MLIPASTPDALALTVQWAKMFQPWVYNKTDRTWTEKGLPLARCIARQFQEALDRGLTPYAVQCLLRSAKERKESVTHVYPLTSKPLSDILASDESESLLDDRVRYMHPLLVDAKGIRIPTFSLADAVAYVQQTPWPIRQTRSTVRILINEWGLDHVLYAADVLKEQDEWHPDSPWALLWAKEEAHERRQRREQAMDGLRRQLRLMEALNTATA